MPNKYIDGGIGYPVFRGPYLQENANMAAFLFKADRSRLKELCDQFLTAPSDGKTKYVPLLSNVVVMYADMLVSSLDERDRQAGRQREKEVGFWILTLAMKKVGGVWVPHHLAWFMPYLFVDNFSAIATGREVYGFNKLLAEIKKLQHIQIPEYAVNVFGVKEFSPTAEAKSERLFDIRRLADSDDGPVGDWESWQAAKDEVYQKLLAHIDQQSKDSLIEFGTKFANQNIPLVFLKQFRDAVDTKLASYQAIIEAPITVKKFHRGGFVRGKYALTINHLDSHPVGKKLGLHVEDGAIQSIIGIWMEVDFSLGAGKVIWGAE